MKQLELQLNKKLLIIETELEFEPREGAEYYVPDDAEELFILPKGTFKLICKGPELSEEVAEKYVSDHEFYDNNMGRSYHGYKDYLHNDYALQSSLESFISAIESCGWYWADNPIGEPNIPQFLNPNKYGHCENDYVAYRYDLHQFNEAESRTFNPEKTWIFEILP